MFLAAALAACAAPHAPAQQGTRVRRVGWLDFSSAAENIGAFTQAMRARGWTEGQTFRIDYKGGEGRRERLAVVAGELARVPVDVIVAPGTPETLAARSATTKIPIVMIGVDDPVERGIVASLARPGGNVTGLANAGKELNGKLLSLVREIVPAATTVGVLSDATNPDSDVVLAQLKDAARSLAVTLHAISVRRHTDVEPAFATLKGQGCRALVVSGGSVLLPRWIADLALKNALPVASTSPAYVYEGGLLAYSDDWDALYARVATFVDRILRDAPPATMPVELPSKFRLIVNTRAAHALGVAIPASIRVRADSIIE